MRQVIQIFSSVILVLLIHNCSLVISVNITGTWESISVENPAPFFSKVLPSHEKGEIILTFYKNGIFNWKNRKEKTNLTGRYSFIKNSIFFNADNEIIPVKAEFRLKDNCLVLKTSDGFTFTFVKIP